MCQVVYGFISLHYSTTYIKPWLSAHRLVKLETAWLRFSDMMTMGRNIGRNFYMKLRSKSVRVQLNDITTTVSNPKAHVNISTKPQFNPVIKEQS